MISFVTNYDEATRCNYDVYLNCGITAPISLLAHNATTHNLISHLSSEVRNVFAMSHGGDNKLCDQGGNDTFTASSLSSLSNGESFNVFAYACNTSITLGRNAAQNNIRWFGFIQPINSPDTEVSFQSVYADIFGFIYDNFPNVSCVNSAESFLDELKQICDSKNKDIDEIASLDENISVISAYMSVKQMWEKQKIWLSAQCSVVHPDTQAPISW
ncbi:TPA: hypothetical protein NJZ52_004404 [Vibrio parahaemolyticus]|nr:hypothetical protein [Vibrio parahaemolyticus]